MNNNTQKLTLDQPVAYQIKVPGVLDERWSDWDGDIMSAVERDSDGLSITILTATVDQAALHSLLRRLYGLGLPLLSVICVDYT